MSDSLQNDQETTTNNIPVDVNSTAKGEPTHTGSPEVNPKRRNRRYPAEYKLATLSELDHCSSSSERGAILRREGLYASIISEWRKSRDAGALSALNKLRGRKNKYDAKDTKISALEKELAALKGKLSQAEAIIDVQKKVSEIFGISAQSSKKIED